MQIGERCAVHDELARWSGSSPKEFKKVLKRLRTIVEGDDFPALATVKRVGPERRIIQIAGDSGRFYCFEDSDGLTVVCVHTFWIGSGDKNTAQDQAIREAESLMSRWLSATPIQGVEDLRFEKRGK